MLEPDIRPIATGDRENIGFRVMTYKDSLKSFKAIGKAADLQGLTRKLAT
ncbi:MAG TPA: hypothetical protein VLF09_02570 [Cellvibrio sp.]|nr:hypothetical protein [Cellvibrio sp.]